jgi:hypothetical protein
MRKSNAEVAKEVLEEAAGAIIGEVILALREAGIVLPLGTMQAIFARVQARVERMAEEKSWNGK